MSDGAALFLSIGMFVGAGVCLGVWVYKFMSHLFDDRI